MQNQAFLVVRGELFPDKLALQGIILKGQQMSRWGTRSLSFLRKLRDERSPLPVIALIYPRTSPDGRIDWQRSQIGNLFPLGHQPQELRAGFVRVIGRCRPANGGVRVQIRPTRGAPFWLFLASDTAIGNGLWRLEGELISDRLQVRQATRCRASARAQRLSSK